MDAKQFKKEVVIPTLKYIGRYSEDAANLIVGTMWQESHGEYIKQLGNGPALGFMQMEPATHDDIWNNYLKYKGDLETKVKDLAIAHPSGKPSPNNLMYSLPYQVAMCRCHYLRVKEGIPNGKDVEGMAHYWKKYYNTSLGKGKPEEFVKNFPTEILS